MRQILALGFLIGGFFNATVSIPCYSYYSSSADFSREPWGDFFRGQVGVSAVWDGRRRANGRAFALRWCARRPAVGRVFSCCGALSVVGGVVNRAQG